MDTGVAAHVDDRAKVWLLAGQDLLRGGGVGAVKLHALTARTGLTTGSFYHHFSGMSAYLERLADFYGDDQVSGALEQLAGLSPRERLAGLGRIALDDNMFPLAVAMRDWAGSDERAAAAVRVSDAQLLRFIADAFRDLGFDDRSADIRAFILLATGVARISEPSQARPSMPEMIAILAE